MRNKKINIWKISTIVLIFVCIFIVGYSAYKNYNSEINWKESICSNINGTPSWINENGGIIYEGFVPLLGLNQTTNETIKLTTKESLNEMWIDSKITFVYHSDCGYCKEQIRQFNEYNFWEEYVNSGLTIDCKEEQE